MLKSINRLLEIEQGTWKIEEEANQWYLNLYPTEDSGAPANPLYETTLNVGQPFAKYLLQDIDGLPTNVNAMRRIQSSITSLP